MLEHTSFTFNNISTDDLGLMMIQRSGGLYDESFLGNRKLNETTIYKGKKRYFKGVEVDPLSFSFAIWIKEWKERENLRAIARWLTTESYAPFWFNDEPDKVYYAILVDEPRLIHTGNNEGTIQVTFRCDSEFSYSHPVTQYFNVRDSEIWYFFNEGDESIRPYLKITQLESMRPIIIKNVTDNKEFILNNILEGEVVYIDCENEIIRSDRENNNRYLYDSHNGYWLDFDGEDARESMSDYEIEFQGNFDIEFTYEYKYKQQGDGVGGW